VRLGDLPLLFLPMEHAEGTAKLMELMELKVESPVHFPSTTLRVVPLPKQAWGGTGVVPNDCRRP
jgi:hypothetical protein